MQPIDLPQVERDAMALLLEGDDPVLLVLQRQWSLVESVVRTPDAVGVYVDFKLPDSVEALSGIWMPTLGAIEDIEDYVPHQANARINDLMKKNLGLGDDVPVANDIENTGNTSAASIPLAMEEMLVTGKAKGGQLALLLGFGAGLSYAGQVVTLPPVPVETSF